MRVIGRGRAIVRRLPSRMENRTFRPGDFVLTRTSGALAGMTGLATGGVTNHAALIVDASGGLIEVNPALAMGHGPLRRAHIADYLEAGAPCWVGYVELAEGTRQAVIEFAERHYAMQATLSEVGVAMLAITALVCVAPRARTARHAWLRPLAPLFDRHALILREEHTYLAGEFVARALERGGFHWDVDPAYVTPAELFERFHLREDGESGVLVTLAEARRDRKALPAASTDRGPALVSPFVPRATAGHRQGAALRLVAAEPEVAVNPDGMRALAQVALVTFGGFALLHGLELVARALRGE
jgi:hypothetical protein